MSSIVEDAVLLQAVTVQNDRSAEQLQRDVEELRAQIGLLMAEVCGENGEGIVEIMGNVIRDLKERVSEQERATRELKGQMSHLMEILSGGVNVTTRRAYLLADAVKASGQGFITRAQARNVLTEEGLKPGTKPTNDAMLKAAEMFKLIYTKNKKGEVILAVA